MRKLPSLFLSKLIPYVRKATPTYYISDRDVPFSTFIMNMNEWYVVYSSQEFIFFPSSRCIIYVDISQKVGMHLEKIKMRTTKRGVHLYTIHSTVDLRRLHLTLLYFFLKDGAKWIRNRISAIIMFITDITWCFNEHDFLKLVSKSVIKHYIVGINLCRNVNHLKMPLYRMHASFPCISTRSIL